MAQSEERDRALADYRVKLREHAELEARCVRAPARALASALARARRPSPARAPMPPCPWPPPLVVCSVAGKRAALTALRRKYAKTEDDIKALRSTGQMVGELLKQLDEER